MDMKEDITMAVEKKPAPSRAVRIWKDVRDAIKGSDQDFTEGGIGRAIVLLSIPMVLEMAMESVFAIVDIFFVSRLGADAVATVGITESLLTVIYAICVGLSMGTTAMVSRRVGEKNTEEASRTAVQAIALGIFLSLPIGYLGFFHAVDLLSLMGATKEMMASSSMYPLIMIGSNIVIMLLFIINAVFRGAGDASIAMRALWVANIINIILDPCLIFGWGPFPEMGITGAAVATTIGRGIGVVYQFILLGNSKHRIKIKKEHIKIDRKIIKKLLHLSLGGVGQFLISTSSWIGLVRIMAVFGSHALAGYTIAIRIVGFSILPSWGMANAAATLVGQNLGAKKPDRAEKSVWITAFANMVFLGIIGLVFIGYSDFLIRIFTSNPMVIKNGAMFLRYISYGYLAYAFGMVLSQSFNGAGDTFTPTVMNFFCFWLLEIPLAYVLAFPLGLAEKGVVLAIVVAETVLGITAIILFRQGRWKTRKV